MILWKRSEEEWDAIVEALEDKLEEEHDKRLAVEAELDELRTKLEARAESMGRKREEAGVSLGLLPPQPQ